MKTLLVLFVSMMALQAAGPAGGTAQLALPTGAVAVASGVYRYADAQGKTWIYRQTPFGITRFEAPATAVVASSARPDEWANTKAWDDGDGVRFERQGPFGVSRWRTAKSALSAAERSCWERQPANQAGGKD
jgi:hypothetical protein